MVNIAIIGAGINGASTGYLLKCRYPSVNVTIISKTFSPNTTSDGAAGFWEPLMAGNTPEDLIKYVYSDNLATDLENLESQEK